MSFIIIQMFTAMNLPPAVLYLDCEHTQADTFSLRWCLPQTGDIPITNSMAEVNNGSNEWKPLDGPIPGISFIYQGSDSFLWYINKEEMKS